MKKRILSLLLVVAIAVGLFVGCKNSKNTESIALADVTATPMEYVEAGLEKSFSKSPFGSIVALGDTEATAIEIKAEPDNGNYFDLNATVAHKTLSVLANLTVRTEGQEIAGSIFVDKENLALKSDLLTMFIGAPSVGIELKDFAKNFQESAWYDLFIVQGGLEEMLKNQDGETVDLQEVINLSKTLFVNVDKIQKEHVEYKVVESQVTVNNKNVECFQITELTSDGLNAALFAEIDKFYADLGKLIPTIATSGLDETLKSLLGQANLKTETTYYVAKNGGALMQINTNIQVVTDGEDEQSVAIMINFGEKPEETFLPYLEIKVVEGEYETVLVGQSTIDKSSKTFNFNVNVDDNDLGELAKATFTLGNDGNFKLGYTANEESNELTGTFKVDGSKLVLTVNVDDGDATGKISINLDFNAEKQTGFEYDDMLKWDAEKISTLMMLFMKQ